MYDLMYVDTDTMPPEDNFTVTKAFFDNYKKISTPGQVQKNWLEFIHISSEYYGLDVKFYETDMKNNQTTHPTIKLNDFNKILWSLSNNGLLI